MKQYQRFVFDSYSFNPEERKIELRYGLDDEIHFTETLQLPEGKNVNASPLALDAALRALHLIGGISYYKTCLPKTIEIRNGSLNADQAKFWNTVYENGLGEFFFRNNIDFHGLINFPISNETTAVPASTKKFAGVLVPIGGGKDSAVTTEILKKEGKNITLMRLGKHPLIEAFVKASGIACITIERRLDKQLFALTAEGALNGHVPITAYLSALCIVLAEIYGYEEVAMSNEKSANYGNVEYLGKEINHQWSKSEEFENLFQSYIRNYIDPNLTYRSMLRDMNELEIVKKFTSYPKYFDCFTSCNKNWKILGNDGVAMNRSEATGSWCGHCPKCAFAFVLFAAFLPIEKLTEIFGGNFFNDEKLIPLYKELLGLEGFKPFECVGTPEETKEAFALAHKRGELDETPIMKMFLQNIT